MKKIINFLLVLLSLSLGSCRDEVDLASSQGPITSNSSSEIFIFGDYELKRYENDQKMPYKVILEVTSERDQDGLYIMKGQNALNFYFAKFATELFTNELVIYGVGTTNIDGPELKKVFDADYIDRLAQVVSYEVDTSGKEMILYLKDERKMIFAKK